MSAWTPIVTGTAAQRCVETAREIAAALAAAPLENPSLASGSAGCALLHAQLHQLEPDMNHDEHALTAIDRAIDTLGEGELVLGLFQGLTGIAWVSEHLQGRLLERGEVDANADVDELLGSELIDPPRTAAIDLVDGYVGFGVYALERLRNGQGRELLSQVLALLEARVDPQPGGLAWRSRDVDHPERTLFDLGVAHGVPGVIALLARMYSAGIESARAERLLRGAVPWMLAQQRADGPSAFAYEADGDSKPARLAWCRGDGGACVALLGAGQALSEQAWIDAALRIARRTLARGRDTGVVDAELCHGAAGLAHLYARLHHRSGVADFAAAAARWCDEALAMRRPEGGYCGYLHHMYGAWESTPGFLMGAAGIALCLLSVATPIEPAWDACLLL